MNQFKSNCSECLLHFRLFKYYIIQFQNLYFCSDNICYLRECGMGKMCKDQQKQDKPKNIKNVYLTKINSLMKLSRDSIAEEEIDIFSQAKEKKIKKTRSDADNTTLRLQKNRQAARKARQRKNLYIKLLENQVKTYNGLLANASKIQKQSDALLSSMHQKIKKEDELDRYISHEDLGFVDAQKNYIQNRIKSSNFLLQEVMTNYFPSLLNNITVLETDQAKQIQKVILGKLDKQQISQDKRREQKTQLRVFMKTVRDEKQKTDQLFNEIAKLNKKLNDLFSDTQLRAQLHHFEDQIRRKIIKIAKDMKLLNVKVPEQKFLKGTNLNQQKYLLLTETELILDKLNKFQQLFQQITKVQQ